MMKCMPAGAQAERADHGGGRSGQQYGSRPEQPARSGARQFRKARQKRCTLEAVKGQNADHVGADAEKRGVAEADHAAVTQHQIQADGGQGVNQDPAEKGNQVGLTGQARQRRAAPRSKMQRLVATDSGLCGLPGSLCMGREQPRGRQTSTAAMRM